MRTFCLSISHLDSSGTGHDDVDIPVVARAIPPTFHDTTIYTHLSIPRTQNLSALHISSRPLNAGTLSFASVLWTLDWSSGLMG